MSIKLEWDFSESPHDNPIAPRNTVQDRAQNARSDQRYEQGNRNPPKSYVGRGLWRWWRPAGVALLAAVVVAALWFFTQAGWQKVTGDVVAAVNYEDQRASQGAANLVLNVQDQGNADWLSVRQDEALAKQPSPLPAPMLTLGQAPPKLADLTALGADFVVANVDRQFTAPDGQTLAFVLPQFYRRGGSNDWLRSAPPGSFWGNWLDWYGAQLVIRYSERDAAFVSKVAPVLDRRLADACSLWVGGCPSQGPTKLYLSGFVGSLEYDPISNIEARIELGTAGGSALTPADYFLSIPSPQIAGIPSDQAGQTYLADYLSVRLIASLAHHISNTPDRYFQRTSQAIQALGLTRADPGYMASGQQRRNPLAGDTPRFAQANIGRPRGQDRFNWRVVYYATALGDTLPSIAARFSTSVLAIERANRLGNPVDLEAGIRLVIPLFTLGTALSP